MAIAEAQLINKLLDTKDFNSIITDFGVEELDFSVCKEQYEYIVNFYKKYKAVPDKESFIAKFPDFELFKVEEPTRAIVDELFENSLFRRGVKIFNTASSLFEVNAVDGANYLISHINELQPKYTINSVDMMHDMGAYNEWKDKVDNPESNYIEIPFKELNDILHGFERGSELALFLAKSSTGKSQVLSICAEHASKLGNRVGVISPEMSRNQLFMRIVTSRTHISNSALQNGNPVAGFKEFMDKMTASDEHLFISDITDFDNRITLSKVRNFIKSNNLDILFIDGIKYVRPDSKYKGMTETQIQGEVCTELLGMSNEFKIPVVGVVQARRRSNGQSKEESDLIDSESVFESYMITQVCTKMVGLQKRDGILQMNISKNRNGISDVKPLQYQIDFDTLRYTYIPNLEDIKNDKEASEIAEEAKDDFMEVF